MEFDELDRTELLGGLHVGCGNTGMVGVGDDVPVHVAIEQVHSRTGVILRDRQSCEVIDNETIHYVPGLSGPYRTPDIRSCQHSCAIEELRYFRHETNYLSAWIARAGRPRHLKVCTGIGNIVRSVGRAAALVRLDP